MTFFLRRFWTTLLTIQETGPPCNIIDWISSQNQSGYFTALPLLCLKSHLCACAGWGTKLHWRPHVVSEYPNQLLFTAQNNTMPQTTPSFGQFPSNRVSVSVQCRVEETEKHEGSKVTGCLKKNALLCLTGHRGYQKWTIPKSRVFLKSSGNFPSDEHKNLYFFQKMTEKMSLKMPTSLEKRHAFGSH